MDFHYQHYGIYMSVRLPPFISLVFKKSEKTADYLEQSRKRHESLIAEIEKQLLPGDELPVFIHEDDNLFADIVGNDVESLKDAIQHATEAGLVEGEDFVSMNYAGERSKSDWVKATIQEDGILLEFCE